jgi:hypothetical protein
MLSGLRLLLIAEQRGFPPSGSQTNVPLSCIISSFRSISSFRPAPYSAGEARSAEQERSV